MGKAIKTKFENQSFKLMPLPLNVLKYLTSKTKPDKNAYIKNQYTQFILK